MREAALLPGEDAEAYAAIEAAVRDCLAPADGLAEMWVADIAALTWEIARAQRMRSELIKAGEGEGAGEIFRLFRLKDAPYAAAAWAGNEPGDRALILEYAAEAGLGRDAFITQTVIEFYPQVEALDRHIESLRARRLKFLGWVEQPTRGGARLDGGPKRRRIQPTA
ncbi:hypothetical protein [Alsobacter soli]|uniref:hypothetical protein n=1 Tax=Alsobacter soli TaxID=2109933 RepID=UPI0011B20763|nr:hypothetical protein [Alsobacter soli]